MLACLLPLVLGIPGPWAIHSNLFQRLTSPAIQATLLNFGMYTSYRWVWAGLGYLLGCYALMGAAVCAAFSVTPVRPLLSLMGKGRGDAPALIVCWGWRAGTR